ncbi:MAG: HDOD domain-containing protein [Acidimicrobiales bacterium]
MTMDQLPPELIRAENLPSPPGVALQVIRLADDPNARANDLGALIRHDPALSVRLLRIVNSAAHGLPRTIDSVERACALLGFEKAKTVAIGLSVTDSLPTVGPETGFDLEDYWLRSGLTATAAELFAKHVSPDHAEVAFVVGLLSEVGRLVLAACLTSTYSTILKENPWPPTKLERERIGFSNLDLSSAMFRNWALPAEISEPIAYRDEPDKIPAGSSSDILRLCRILASAEILARVWATGAAQRDLNWAGAAAAHYLHMPPDDFVTVVGELRTSIESREAFETVAPPSVVNVSNIEQRACEQLKEAVSRSSGGSRVADMLRAAHA